MKKLKLTAVGMDEKTGARIWSFFDATTEQAAKHLRELKKDNPRVFFNPTQKREKKGGIRR